jgi:hypothetical protein
MGGASALAEMLRASVFVRICTTSLYDTAREFQNDIRLFVQQQQRNNNRLYYNVLSTELLQKDSRYEL